MPAAVGSGIPAQKWQGLLSVGKLTWEFALAYCLTGLPVDCVQAIATWSYLWFAAKPMLEKLDRLKVKYGLAK